MQSKCHINVYGVYVWTAGQRVDPNTRSKFVWKLSSGKGAKECPMRYTKWTTSLRQPDWSQGTKRLEACINLWPKYNYAWNDDKCSRKLCYVCEHRPGDDCPR